MTLGAQSLLARLSRLVQRSPADGTSLCCIRTAHRVLRFSHGAIHQHAISDDGALYVTVRLDHRVGVAVTNMVTPQAMRETLDRALEIARLAPPQPRLALLPTGRALPWLKTYVPATAAFTGRQAVEWITRLVQIARGCDAELAGSLLTGEDEMAVVNSAGLARYQSATVAGLRLIALHGPRSGFATATVRDIRRLDGNAALERALRKAIHPKAPEPFPVGRHRVLLEPEAVSELLSWLGYIGFGAKAFQERTSFMAGRIGERLMHRAITITDEARNPAGLAEAFDCEGVATRRVVLIDKGIARGIVYDSDAAQRYGTTSTGHASAPDSGDGPFPGHLVIAPGRTSRAELLRKLGTGILVTRFHYVNGFLNTRSALMTGLTRDGTFWVERGALKHPLTNARFTESVLEAFARVEAVSKERQLVADPAQGGGAHLVPALLLNGFTFTGASQ